MNNIGLYCIYSFLGALVVSIILSIIGFLIYKKKEKSGDNVVEYLSPFSPILFMVEFIIAFLCFCVAIRFTCIENRYVGVSSEENVVKIVSVNLNSESSVSGGGSFILGTGSVSIEGRVDNYFYYYVKDENNRFKLSKINAESVLIEENNEVEPSIVTTENYDVYSTTPTWFGELLGFEYEEQKYLVDGSTEIVMYIPEGSVMQEYNPNMN